MNTKRIDLKTHAGRARAVLAPLAMLAILAINNNYTCLAQESTPQTFPSAADAVQSLFQAVQANNEQAIEKILGGPTDLTSCRDERQDKADRELFVQKYQQMHRLHSDPDGSLILYIGAENWPFPIPLVAMNGAWRFDPRTGMTEVMFRRIGENELTAIATAHEFVAAERQYRTSQNTPETGDSSPASLVAKAATGSGDRNPILFHGYYFRVFSTRPESNTQGTGGFALIAWPAEYRSSGVMTFIVTGSDVVYEKDLGAKTGARAEAMTTFRKDATWRVAEE